MTDAPAPAIRQKKKRRISLIWLVPIVAAIAGAVLVLRSYQSQGPQLTIRFETANSIDAGKTEVRYKDVVVGKVTDVRLGNDDNVVVDVSLRHSARQLAVADSRFWVVRPRLDTRGISGLNTLLSGAYIGVDAGASSQRQTNFLGLEAPPPVTQNAQGRRVQLVGSGLGSLDVGSPVYYRHLEAGQVTSYQLDEHGERVAIEVFLQAPYDEFIHRQSRFWNASGINVSVAGGAVSLQTQSLTTVLLGGIAFGNPTGFKRNDVKPAKPDQLFTLFDSKSAAMEAAPVGESMKVEFLFDQSIAGLKKGAGVQFLGLQMGKVTRVEVDYIPAQQRFYGIVTAEITPQKLGPAYHNLLASIEPENRSIPALLKRLIKQGLRARMQSANILTGQQQIVLAMLPETEQQTITQGNHAALRIPTTPSALDALQVQITQLLKKFQQVPVTELSDELRSVMQAAQSTIDNAGSVFNTLNKELLPSTQTAIRKLGEATQRITTAVDNTVGDEDAVLIIELRRALQEADRALRSVRALAESVKRDPQQILLGQDEASNPFAKPNAPQRRLAPGANTAPSTPNTGPRR